MPVIARQPPAGAPQGRPAARGRHLDQEVPRAHRRARRACWPTRPRPTSRWRRPPSTAGAARSRSSRSPAEGHGGADPARRAGHARRRARHDPQRQGQRGRPEPQPRDAAARALLRALRRPPRRAHRAHRRPDAGHGRLDDRHRRPAQARAAARTSARWCWWPRPRASRALETAHPDVRCWTAAIDSHLNEIGYIIPGLGDAGDKIFGTK